MFLFLWLLSLFGTFWPSFWPFFWLKLNVTFSYNCGDNCAENVNNDLTWASPGVGRTFSYKFDLLRSFDLDLYLTLTDNCGDNCGKYVNNDLASASPGVGRAIFWFILPFVIFCFSCWPWPFQITAATTVGSTWTMTLRGPRPEWVAPFSSCLCRRLFILRLFSSSNLGCPSASTTRACRAIHTLEWSVFNLIYVIC